jgi:hypothetical protein
LISFRWRQLSIIHKSRCDPIPEKICRIMVRPYLNLSLAGIIAASSWSVYLRKFIETFQSQQQNPGSA